MGLEKRYAEFLNIYYLRSNIFSSLFTIHIFSLYTAFPMKSSYFCGKNIHSSGERDSLTIMQKIFLVLKSYITLLNMCRCRCSEIPCSWFFVLCVLSIGTVRCTSQSSKTAGNSAWPFYWEQFLDYTFL